MNIKTPLPSGFLLDTKASAFHHNRHCEEFDHVRLSLIHREVNPVEAGVGLGENLQVLIHVDSELADISVVTLQRGETLSRHTRCT
jgi:hypothetical protein